MNKYYQILKKVLADGKTQKGRKGESRYLLNETVTLSPAELLDIFEGHNIARKKLRSELSLFMSGERQVEKYREAGINWWDYCGSILVNSYPTYFEKLPPQNQPGKTKQQELRAVPRFDRHGKQPGTMPQPRTVPDRTRRTGPDGLPA